MKTEQINIRLEEDLVSALERIAREEALDRATAIRRLLRDSIKTWELERALVRYRQGEASLGGAAEEAGITQWELIDAARVAGLAYPLTAEEVDERASALSDRSSDLETLPDVPPEPGGVLLVGINPAPVSVTTGHYHGGRIGRRLWRRLEDVGLLDDPVPGKEDEALARAGHGLTDLVKRPTRSAAELTKDELATGVDVLRAKVRDWRPGLVLFVFAKAAAPVLGRRVKPGRNQELEGVPTFLLSGPFAPGAESRRVDDELRELIAGL